MESQRTKFNQHLFSFLDQSPTPFHAVQWLSTRLKQAGFRQLNETQPWGTLAAGRYFITRHDGALIALTLPEQPLADTGLHMVGAHTDSPCLKVKPQPESNQGQVCQLGVEVYGGALLHPWFDRDLSMAGRVTYLDDKQTLHHCLVDFKRPVAVIPSLAIHLDQSANKARTINAQQHLPPIVMQWSADAPFDFRQQLLRQVKVQYPETELTRVLDYDMSLYDVQKATLVGFDQAFISSARLDNLLSCFCAVDALLNSDMTQANLLVLSDHEEVGSVSASGAQGSFLEAVLSRLCPDAESFHRMMQRSMLISTDNAHARHPNYADKHDPAHCPVLNHGPVIKHNANQRYATNSDTSARFRWLCEKAKVPVQDFVVRSDMGCGSTIGPIVAASLGVKTIDVGVPTLAMHSVRELAGAYDACYLSRVLTHFFNDNE